MSKPTTRLDICIPQAGIFRLVIDVVDGPETLTGLDPAMQIRKTKASEDILAEMDLGFFTVDVDNRQVILEIPDTETELYDWTGAGVYDLYLGPWRLIEGKASLDKTVTRED